MSMSMDEEKNPAILDATPTCQHRPGLVWQTQPKLDGERRGEPIAGFAHLAIDS